MSLIDIAQNLDTYSNLASDQKLDWKIDKMLDQTPASEYKKHLQNIEVEVLGRMTERILELTSKYDILQRVTNQLAQESSIDFSEDERRFLLAALALKSNHKTIARFVNLRRKQAGLKSEITTEKIKWLAHMYKDVIEQIYIEYVLNTADMFEFSDKFVRIAKYNDLLQQLEPIVQSHLSTPITDKFAQRTIEIYIRALDRMNNELGATSLAEMVRIKKNGELEGREKSKSIKGMLFDHNQLTKRYGNRMPVMQSVASQETSEQQEQDDARGTSE